MEARRHDADEIVENSSITQQSGYNPAADVPSVNGASTAHPSAVAEKARELAAQAQEKAMELGQKAAESGRDIAASGMHTAATKLREQAGGTSGLAEKAEARVADGMETTAGYLREHDSNEIADQVRRYAKEHPVQAVAGAVLGLFVLRRVLR